MPTQNWPGRALFYAQSCCSDRMQALQELMARPSAAAPPGNLGVSQWHDGKAGKEKPVTFSVVAWKELPFSAHAA